MDKLESPREEPKCDEKKRDYHPVPSPPLGSRQGFGNEPLIDIDDMPDLADSGFAIKINDRVMVDKRRPKPERQTQEGDEEGETELNDEMSNDNMVDGGIKEAEKPDIMENDKVLVDDIQDQKEDNSKSEASCDGTAMAAPDGKENVDNDAKKEGETDAGPNDVSNNLSMRMGVNMDTDQGERQWLLGKASGPASGPAPGPASGPAWGAAWGPASGPAFEPNMKQGPFCQCIEYCFKCCWK